MTNSGYRPEIDGLRAIAVLGVVFYHSGLGVPGGYVGVDVFFVISGFLITGIILRAQEANHFSLIEFFERRLRRIFPAVTAVVFGTITVSYFVLLPSDFKDVGLSAMAQTLFVANVFFWQDTNYFAGPAELKPLLHTWSLAVEEQFYLLLPVLLVALKNQSRQRIFNVLVVITISSFLASLYGVVHHAAATFFLLPTRAWELCCGCLLAASPWKIKSCPRWDGLIAASGLAGVLGSMFLLNRQTPFPGLAALPSVAGATAIIYSTGATKDGVIGRLLAARPLVFVGLVSYSLYLWHWPVLVFFKYAGGQVTAASAGPLFLLIGVLAVLSWLFVEKPFRDKQFLKTGTAVFASSVAVSLIGFGVAAVVVCTDGLKSRFQAELLTLVEDTEWRGLEYHMPKDLAVGRDKLPSLGMAVEGSQRLDYVLWGDSHGMIMSSLFDDISKERGLSGVAIARVGRAPLPNVWNVADRTKAKIDAELDYGQSVLAFLAKERPRYLFLVSRWSAKCEGMSAVELASAAQGAGTAGMLCDSEAVKITPEESARVLKRQLAVLVEACERLGITVWVVKQVPESKATYAAKEEFLRRTGMLVASSNQPTTIADHELRQRRPNEVFDSLAGDNSGVKWMDPSPYYFDLKGKLQTSFEGRAFYRDDDHLTRWGLQRLRPLVEDALMQIQD